MQDPGAGLPICDPILFARTSISLLPSLSSPPITNLLTPPLQEIINLPIHSHSFLQIRFAPMLGCDEMVGVDGSGNEDAGESGGDELEESELGVGV